MIHFGLAAKRLITSKAAVDVGTELAVIPTPVPLVADGFRQVEHDGDGQAVILACLFDQGPARFGLNVRGINNRQSSSCQAFGGDIMQHIERIVCRRLTVLVITHQTSAVVGREHFARQEVLASERALAGTAGADQDDKGKLGDFQQHLRVLAPLRLSFHAVPVGEYV